MIWDRLSILQAIFPASQKAELARKVRRWHGIAKDDTRLVIDVIELGGILTGQPALVANGWPTPVLPDPQTLAYAAGRRDMALQILALMNLTPSETQALMKED